MRDESGKKTQHAMSLPMTGILAIGVFLIASFACAQPRVTTERFDKWYARITLSAVSADSALVAEFDSAFVPFRRVEGVLLDVRDLRAYTPEMVSNILARFTDEPLELDSFRIVPRGPWPYVEPLVVRADSAHRGIEFLRAFDKARAFTEIDFSADSAKAIKRLKRLAADYRIQRQDRMDNLFR